MVAIMAWKLSLRVWRTKLAGKRWTPRRRAFVIDACVLVGLGLAHMTFWLTAHLLLMGEDRCDMGKARVVAIGAMGVLRYTTFSMVRLEVVIGISFLTMCTCL